MDQKPQDELFPKHETAQSSPDTTGESAQSTASFFSAQGGVTLDAADAQSTTPPSAEQMSSEHTTEDTSYHRTGAGIAPERIYPDVPPTAQTPYSQTPPYGAPAPAPAPARPKKAARTVGIILLCLALFAVGVAAGFGVFVAYRERGTTQGEGSQQTPADTIPSVQDTPSTEFRPGVFDPTYGDNEQTYSAAEVYAACVEGVVGISTELTGQNLFHQPTAYAVAGTGFIFSDEGYILTNCHIVEGATSISVSLYDGTELDATLVGMDSQNDVAVVKIETDAPLTVLPIGKSAEMVVGEEILVIGNPLGELTHTLTRGIVSNLSREILTEDSDVPIRMFQTDAAINNGNSGGPAINCYGNVIGLVSAKYASSAIEGLGFCIPIDDAMAIAEDLIEHGYVTGRPYLGLEYKAVSGYSGGNYITGLQVQSVVEGCAAEKSGIRRGDIITEFAGEKITMGSDLRSLLAHYRAGDEVTLVVYRDREYIEVTLILGEATA